MLKTITLKRKIPSVFFLIILFSISVANQAQSVKRQCVSSYGTITVTDDAYFGQTVGQPYNIVTHIGNTTSILQGFQQPVVFRVETIDSELLKDLNLNVYPNPAAYSVTIQSEGIIENAIIRVTDLNGKLILSEKVKQFEIYDINCALWKTGIYFITVSDINRNKSSIKLTINK